MYAQTQAAKFFFVTTGATGDARDLFVTFICCWNDRKQKGIQIRKCALHH